MEWIWLHINIYTHITCVYIYTHTYMYTQHIYMYTQYTGLALCKFGSISNTKVKYIFNNIYLYKHIKFINILVFWEMQS